MAKYTFVLTTRNNDYFIMKIMKIERNMKNGLLGFLKLDVDELRIGSRYYIEEVLNSQGLNLTVNCVTDVSSYSSACNILYVETDVEDISSADYSLVSIEEEDFDYNDVFSKKTAKIVKAIKSYLDEIEEI